MFEHKVEQLCSTILSTDSEFWEVRNKCLNQLIELIMEQADYPDVFTADFFRTLKDPVKILVTDLRSQQVRDVCQFLTTLASLAREKMKLFMRDMLVHLLEALKMPNKVMSGYVDECISNIIKNVQFKSAMVLFVNEAKESKAKPMRERCQEYINQIVNYWDLMEKDAELLLDAIQIGLEDASTKARELARDTYLLLHKAFPKKAERMKANLPQILQQKINKMEVDAGHVSVSESAVKRRPTVNATKKVNGELNSTGSSAEGEDTVVKNLQQNFRNTGTRRQSTVNPFEEITKGSRSRDPTDDIDTHSLSSIDSAHTSPQKNVHANRSATSSPKIMSGKSSPDKTNDLLIRSTVRKSNSDIDFSTSEAAIAEKLFASRTKERSRTPDKQIVVVKPRSATPTGISKIPTNSRVLVSRGPREPKIFGTAKYVGVTAFAPGTWVGVELDDELGKNNGTVQGHYYFTCSSNRGLFVKEENVELVRNTSSAVLPDYAPRYDMVGPPPAPQYSKEDQAILRNASTISELGMNGAVSRSFSNSQSPKHILNADSDDDERTRKDFGTIDSWDKHTIEQVDVNRTISNEPSNIHKSDAVALTPVEEKERRSKVRNLLKLKLSQLMNMLNEQLEIVELLESENEPSDQVSKAKNSVESIRQNILHITDQELELIQSFRTRLINKI